MPTLQIDSIKFYRDDVRNVDGCVVYLVLYPCTHDPCTHVCLTHPKMTHHYERQEFRRGAFGHRADATAKEIAEDRANVWGWDGNESAPTVLPSFLGDRTKDEGKGFRLHHFLRAGKIDLCGDATVTLCEHVPCRDRWSDHPEWAR